MAFRAKEVWVKDEVCANVIIAGPWMPTVDLQMLRGTDFGLGNGEVFMDVILVLAHGRSGERMRPGLENVTLDPWMLRRKDEAWVG